MPPVTFRDLVRAALDEASANGYYPPEFAERLAEALRAQLRGAGFEIHSVGSCVHPKEPAGAFGRPMTDEERQLFGA